MMDLNATLAPEMYLVLRDLRDIEARKLEWNRKLHELDHAAREAAGATSGAPAALAGSHKA